MEKKILNNKKISIITERLKKELELIYSNKLSRLILFGSQARGDANIDSDIDILVVLKGEVKQVNEIMKNSYLISNLCLEYDALINCFYISEEAMNSQNKSLIQNINKDGILI
ncbi:MAG: nucleotidyltransferase domain-containing protein [Cyanobacterium sp. T60_A2020_053]|nr:nucleotidyltransferase domain-containing protein [Cyanobacterium sp. T60_A2020_053]